jgi:hypothetical protein
LNFGPAPKYPSWKNIPPPPSAGPQAYLDYIARKITVGPWKQWFAWYPVKVHNKRLWLKTVYRRSINTYVDMEEWTKYQYGNVFDILKE